MDAHSLKHLTVAIIGICITLSHLLGGIDAQATVTVYAVILGYVFKNGYHKINNNGGGNSG